MLLIFSSLQFKKTFLKSYHTCFSAIKKQKLHSFGDFVFAFHPLLVTPSAVFVPVSYFAQAKRFLLFILFVPQMYLAQRSLRP
jgi:hypothetical protein